MVFFFKPAETIGVKQNKNKHDFSITHIAGFVAMPDFLISNYRLIQF